MKEGLPSSEKEGAGAEQGQTGLAERPGSPTGRMSRGPRKRRKKGMGEVLKARWF